jgi:hypothetical protein
VGTVNWPGAFGRWWQADPNDGSVLIFLAHNMVDLAQMAKGIGFGVWAAIDAFQTSAAASQPWRFVADQEATPTRMTGCPRQIIQKRCRKSGSRWQRTAGAQQHVFVGIEEQRIRRVESVTCDWRKDGVSGHVQPSGGDYTTLRGDPFLFVVTSLDE